MSETTADGGPAEPKARESHLTIDPSTAHPWWKMPDDSPLSRWVRIVDHSVGFVEQGILFALLMAIVLTASASAISEKVFHHAMGRWWFTVVRSGTFAIAMFGAAYATHQQRHLAMDLISRKLSPRGRLVLGIVLKLFTIGIAAVLFRSGQHQMEHVGGSTEEIISDKMIVALMPVGAALVILHSLLHIIIDVDYLARGKLPAEKARTGH